MQQQSSPKRIAPRVFFIKAKNNDDLCYYMFAYDLEDLYGCVEQQISEPLDWSTLLEDGEALTKVIDLHRQHREKTNNEEEFSPHVVYLDRKNTSFLK